MQVIVFVGSPLRAMSRYEETNNIEKAIRLCQDVSEYGAIPIAPHLYCTRFLDDGDTHQRDLGLRISKWLLSCCDVAYFCDDKGVSDGMKGEIAECKKSGMIHAIDGSENIYGALDYLRREWNLKTGKS